MPTKLLAHKKTFSIAAFALLVPAILLSIFLSRPSDISAAGICDNSPSGTLYWFNSGADDRWTTVEGNWWFNSSHTLQSSDPPTGYCIVILPGSNPPLVIVEEADLSTHPAIDATGTSIAFTSSVEAELSVPAIVYGTVDISGSTRVANLSVDGGAVNLHESSKVVGSLSGFTLLTFNDATGNEGNVGSGGNGNLVFNGSSYNAGTTDNTNVTFNDSSSNTETGEIYAFGSALTFNGSSYSRGIIGGHAAVYLNTDYYGGVAPTGGLLTLHEDQTWRSISEGIIYGSDAVPITSYVFNDFSTHGLGSVLGGDTVVFNDESSNHGGVSNHAVTFNASSSNANDGGYINGPSVPVFNGNSYNAGNIEVQNAVFNGSSYNQGDLTVSNSVAFNGSSYNSGVVLGTGTATFNTNYYGGTLPIGGQFWFNGDQTWTGVGDLSVLGSDAQPITEFIFNDQSINTAVITANAVFNGLSMNSNYVNGNVIFNATSSNPGSVNGNATFNDNSFNQFFVSGVATYNDFSHQDASSDYGAVTIFNDSSYNNAGANIYTHDVTFNGQSYNLGYVDSAVYNTTYYSGDIVPTNGIFNVKGGKEWSGTSGGVVYGFDLVQIISFDFYGTSSNQASLPTDASFNDSSFNNSEVYGAANFNANSYNATSGIAHVGAQFAENSVNYGTINEGASFYNSSFNRGTIIGDATFSTDYYGGIVPVGGSLVIGSGRSWYGSISGNSYDSNNAPINSFTFNGTSTNEGTVPGSATSTFNGDFSENNETVSGPKVRRYSSAATTTRNFVTDGPWTVLADGVVVDVSGSTYNATTTFATANGGSFAHIATTCSAPLVGNGLTYFLSGDVAGSCTIAANNVTLDGRGYSVGGGISGNGSGSAARGFDFSIRDISVTGEVSSSGGSGALGGHGGSISISTSTLAVVSANGGDGSGNGGNGGSISISGSTATIIWATGGSSSNTGAGGNGGTVEVIDSSYVEIVVTAGDDGPNKNPGQGSGQGGSSQVRDNVPPVISLVGSASISISEGSSYSELGATAADVVSGSRPVVISGSVNTAVPGAYTITYTATDAAGNIASRTRTVTVTAVVRGCTDSSATNYNPSAVINSGCSYPAVSGGAGSGTSGGSSSSGGLQRGIRNVGILAPLSFQPLPSFTAGLSTSSRGTTEFGNLLQGLGAPGALKLSTISFKFVPQVSAFLFAPLPPSVAAILKKSPKLSGYLASAGLTKEQDLVTLLRNPIPLSLVPGEEKPPGLYFVSASGTPLTAFVSSDAEHPLMELVRVAPGSVLDISLVPLSSAKVTGTFAGKPVAFFASRGKEVHAVVAAPTEPGRYFLMTAASPLPLAVEVVAVPEQEKETAKPSLLKRFSGWLKGVFR